jgi:hypothetical protein
MPEEDPFDVRAGGEVEVRQADELDVVAVDRAGQPVDDGLRVEIRVGQRVRPGRAAAEQPAQGEIAHRGQRRRDVHQVESGQIGRRLVAERGGGRPGIGPAEGLVAGAVGLDRGGTLGVLAHRCSPGRGSPSTLPSVRNPGGAIRADFGPRCFVH